MFPLSTEVNYLNSIDMPGPLVLAWFNFDTSMDK